MTTSTTLRVVHNDHGPVHLVVAGPREGPCISQRIDAMSPKALLSRLPVDPYIAAIVGMVCLASGLPAYPAVGSHHRPIRHVCRHRPCCFSYMGRGSPTPGGFGHSASHWRLHAMLVGLASTFILFPALGLGAKSAVSVAADTAALDWRDPALRTAFDQSNRRSPLPRSLAAATSRPHFAPRPRPTFWAWD